jgi:tyrosyl-tRNA synthetase
MEAVLVLTLRGGQIHAEQIMNEFLLVDEQFDLLQKGAAEIIRVSDLRERLAESRKIGRPLCIKAGFDPTSPNLHLGHTVLMRKLYPMVVKKQLARTLVEGFHTEAAAADADANGAKLFQQKEVAENLEEVAIRVTDVAGAEPEQVRLPKLLVALRLADSGAEASRKIAEIAVKLDGVAAGSNIVTVSDFPEKVNVRLGKRAKMAVIE